LRLSNSDLSSGTVVFVGMVCLYPNWVNPAIRFVAHFLDMDLSLSQ
jgi:hypothetical protein